MKTCIHSPKSRRYPATVFATVFLLFATTLGAQDISESVRQQIVALSLEKAARTPVQRKMDSQLVYAVKKARNEVIAAGVEALEVGVKVEADKRVLVDIDATVTKAVINQIEQAGGTIMGSYPAYNAIRALVPLPAIEALAGLPDVRFVQPAVKALTNLSCCGDNLSSATGNALSAIGEEVIVNTGSVTSEGDITHRAAEARANFGTTGSGIKVGVLSDSVDFLAASQASGNLPAVTVLEDAPGSSGEGTAMLEIIHDLAPGAQLYFATAFSGPAGFAQNILNLRAAGCDIIIDDVGYFNESPFQDGPIAQAVNTVTAAGALYFSSAANSGNKNDNTSGTWEGDFLDGGAATIGDGGRLHNFGGGATFVTATTGSGSGVGLFWSDPLGGAGNDYDLYILDSTGATVLRSSTNNQTGTQDPYESVGPLNANERIVIVKFSGSARFLHLDTRRGTISISTAGETHGHSAAAAAFSVAATWVRSPAVAFTGGATNPVETFSSDGPRRIFYNANGTAITPGNFSSTGGVVRQKPDITAADGGVTSVPGFANFFGTSAAAPHAGAIAALIRSYNSTLTSAQIRTLLTTTALDIEAAGVDRDSGSGIVMAQQALAAAPVPIARLVFQTATVSGGNGNARIDPNECNQLQVGIRNVIGSQAAMGVNATLTSVTPGVFITQPSSAYPNIAVGSTVNNTTMFQVSTVPGLICGTTIQFVLTVNTSNAGSFILPFSLATGVVGAPVAFASSDVPKAIVDLGQVDSNVVVAGVSQIGKVTVSLYLTHTYDSDLTIQLIGPDATTVNLAAGRGGSGDNFGASCASRTVFDDAAANSITSGVAPFVGTFRPEQPLSAFNTKSGAAANGTWKLRIIDSAGDDVGTLSCWTLTIAPILCTDGGGVCPFPGFLRFSGPTFNVNEPSLSATITVQRVGGSLGAIAVDYATVGGGTATAGTDYVAAAGTLNWANGDTNPKSFTIPIANDAADESDETVNLALSSPTGGALLTPPTTAVLNIRDNDGPILITHSLSQTITQFGSVSCNTGDPNYFHYDNSYWRAFNLPSFGINGPFNVTSIDIGIDEATGAGGGTQPTTARLYRTTSGVFPTGARTQIGIANFQIPTQLGTIMNLPVAGLAPVGSELVVEIFTPNGSVAGHRFFVGANSQGETGPSYLTAGAPCNITTPTTAAAIGFPNMQIVMNVRGIEDGLELVSAASVKTHGGAGTFAIPLALFGPSGIECRTGNGGVSGTHTLIFDFNRAVSSGSAVVSAGIGSVSGVPSFSGNRMTVNLTGVADVQNFAVTLSAVTATNGAVLSVLTVPMGVLQADVNADRVDNGGDVILVKASASPGTVNAGNFRRDVNADGVINGADVIIAKSKSGHSIP